LNAELTSTPLPSAAREENAMPVILAVMPSIPVGGMERANIEIFRLLKEHGARVVVLTNKEHGERIESVCASHGIETMPIAVHCDPRFPRGPIAFSKYVLEWLRFVRAVLRACRSLRPQWLYITNLTFFLYAWPTLLLWKCRVIFNLPIPPDVPSGRAKSIVVRWLWRRLVAPACTLMICNSHFTLNRLLATGAKPRSVRVIYNPIPSRLPHRLPLVLPTGKDRLRVTYVGRLAEPKGLAQLFEVAVQIVRERGDVDFYFAGDYRWKNPFAMQLVRRVEVGALEDRIVFLGEVEDVPGLLSQSDLHVLFSNEEAFGLVVLEAKGQGVPSIVSPGGALPELVTHLEDGYVCRDFTTGSLREGLQYFLGDPLARQRAGQQAFQSLQNFDKQAIGRQWATTMSLR